MFFVVSGGKSNGPNARWNVAMASSSCHTRASRHSRRQSTVPSSMTCTVHLVKGTRKWKNASDLALRPSGPMRTTIRWVDGQLLRGRMKQDFALIPRSAQQCSKPCNGGTQRRSVRCTLHHRGQSIDNKYCQLLEKEPLERACNTQECPKWQFGDESSVSCLIHLNYPVHD